MVFDLGLGFDPIFGDSEYTPSIDLSKLGKPGNTGSTSGTSDTFSIGNLSNLNTLLKGFNELGNKNTLLGGLQLGLGGLNTLGSLYVANKQLGLADKNYDLQKKAFDTNLFNQTKSYNTKLEDIIRARYNTEGRSQQEADNYINSHKL